MAYTRCPHCRTWFRVAPEQIQAAAGQARCGRCGETFDGYAALRDSLPVEVREAPAAGAVPGQTAAPGTTDTRSSRQTAGERGEASPVQAGARAPRPLPFEVPDNLPELEPVQTDLRGARSPGGRQTLLWGLGALALLATLGLQLAWMERYHLVRHGSGQRFLSTLCSIAPCTPPLLRDPGRMRVLSREVYSHPQVERALEAVVEFTNAAGYPQAYPLLRLSLFDADGSVAAERVFLPAEYTSSPPAEGAAVAPGQRVQGRLELADPGQDVSGFRFDFL